MVGWLRRLCGGLVAEAMWWVAGEIGNKAISASNLVEVEVEVEAELGNYFHKGWGQYDFTNINS